MSREMKDSGIEWEKSVPLTWNKCRLKDYYTFEKGKNASVYTKNYNGLHKGIYPVYSGQTENNGIMGQIDTYDYDIQECLFTTTVGAKVMAPKILKGKFSLSQNCLIMRNYTHYKCFNQFIYYLLFPLFDYEKSKIPSYMQPSLRIEDLKTYTFYIPTFTEQQKIASFLDEKTKEIDNTIEKTKETIELYKKYKQSIIYKTVCKGIDNHHLKNTGSKYWVKIPIEWQMVKVKRIFEIVKRIAGEEGYTILSITQKGIKEKDISHNEGQVAADYSNYQFVYPGDFAMNHMDLLTGWVDISKYFGVTSPDYRVFRLKYSFQHDNRYWLYVMQTCYMNKIFYSLARGVSTLGRWRLQAESFNNFEVPVPTLEEQKQIADYLDDKISSIDGLINYKEKFITQLENYKKSLIYEYVTGKKEI
jgi:type I restriction enzyme S subunit